MGQQELKINWLWYYLFINDYFNSIYLLSYVNYNLSSTIKSYNYSHTVYPISPIEYQI